MIAKQKYTDVDSRRVRAAGPLCTKKMLGLMTTGGAFDTDSFAVTVEDIGKKLSPKVVQALDEEVTDTVVFWIWSDGNGQGPGSVSILSLSGYSAINKTIEIDGGAEIFEPDEKEKKRLAQMVREVIGPCISGKEGFQQLTSRLNEKTVAKL